jgi:hypothetical protein
MVTGQLFPKGVEEAPNPTLRIKLTRLRYLQKQRLEIVKNSLGDFLS